MWYHKSRGYRALEGESINAEIGEEKIKVFLMAHFKESRDYLSSTNYKIYRIVPKLKPEERDLVVDYIERTFWLDSFVWENPKINA